jgi:hypothetical protein
MTEPTPNRGNEYQGVRFSGLDWYCQHQHELREAYPDEWILIKDGAVVAHSADPKEARRQMLAKGINGGMWTFVPKEPRGMEW